MMNKRWNHPLALLLTLSIAFILLCGCTWAAYASTEEDPPQVMNEENYEDEDDDFNRTFDSDTGVLTISGTGAMPDDSGCSGFPRKSIKKVIIQNGITTIGWLAFEDCVNLKSVSIPDSITTIESSAFWGCSNLKSITIPHSVTKIGETAFYGCKNLSSISLPDSITSIGDTAFAYCSSLESIKIPKGVTVIQDNTFHQCKKLTSITIPNGVTKIPESVFYGSGLTRVTIPKSVTSLAFGDGGTTFDECRNLKSVTVDKDNKKYASKNGIVFNKSMNRLLFCPSAKTGTYAIPSSVTEIGADSFSWARLTKVTIPKSVTKIGREAFFITELKHVTIEEGVKTIGDWAFCRTNLTSIKIPASVTSLGDSLLAYSGYSKWAKSKIKKVYFMGNRPKMVTHSAGAGTFEDVTATAYYPAGNKTWTTSSLKKNYGGKITWKKYNPYTTTLTSVTGGSKKVTVKWKKTDRVSGYQVQYATNKTFKNPKSKLVKGKAKTSATLSKLTAKKKYFVRVHTYRVDSGKKYYSAWSNVKAATTK